MRSPYKPWLAAAILAGAAGGPAFAGAVYVPVPDVEVAGVRLETQVLVANTTAAAGTVRTFFIPNNTDGTARPAGNRPVAVQIPAGSMLQFPDVAGRPAGLLEIDGNPGFAVSAHLVGPDQPINLPVVSSENLVAADAIAHLQGLTRDDARLTGIGLINLEQGAAQCTVRVFRVDGRPLGAAVTVTLPPLSQRELSDPLAPETNLSSARATATCNRPFYAYVTTLDSETGEVVWNGPGEATSSTLVRPGDEPPPGPCGAAIDCIIRNGVVFQPTRSAPTSRIALPFSRSIEYKKARLQMDVTLGNWNNQQRDGIHHLFTLARGDNETRLGYAAVRGPSRNFVFFLHNLGLDGQAGNRFQQDVQLQTGQTYHVDYTYDPVNSRAVLVLSRNGAEVARLSDSATFVDVIRSNGQSYFVELGLAPSGPHAPTYGWTYSNLKVEFFK